MNYEEVAKALEEMERTSSYIEKTRILSRLLRNSPPDSVDKIIMLITGSVYPEYEDKEFGLGPELVKEAIGRATGFGKSTIDEELKKLGDLGLVAEKLASRKRQVTLFQEVLTIDKVFETLRRIAEVTGEGSQERKVSLLAGLLSSATPREAKYIVRTILGQLRAGVAEGRIRDAIAQAFGIPPELVERAYMFIGDFSEVARIAATEGREGLEKLTPKPGIPVRVMLAQRAESIREALTRMGGKAAFEWKLDGMRLQPHKLDGGEVKLFTRRLEDVTYAFPEIVDAIREHVRAREAILDGELIAFDPKTKKPMPFQEVLKRRRKHEVAEMKEEIPLMLSLFDVIYLDGKPLMEMPYVERRKILEQIVEPEKDLLEITPQIISSDEDEIRTFMNKALEAGHEGLLAKRLNSVYRAGRREFDWLKIKPRLDTVDLVVVGAFYGRGKRAGVFGSYLMAVRDEKSGNFLTITKLGSGFTDAELEEMTRLMSKYVTPSKPQNVIAEITPDVWIEPKVVFEVAYEEIQKSPEEKHTSGFGLRFPRFVRIREDKRPEDCTTLSEMQRLYEIQERMKGGKK